MEVDKDIAQAIRYQLDKFDFEEFVRMINASGNFWGRGKATASEATHLAGELFRDCETYRRGENFCEVGCGGLSASINFKNKTAHLRYIDCSHASDGHFDIDYSDEIKELNDVISKTNSVLNT